MNDFEMIRIILSIVMNLSFIYLNVHQTAGLCAFIGNFL